MKAKFFINLAILGLLCLTGFSQDKTKIGIAGTVQDNQFGVNIPIWVGENAVLAPAFDFKYAKTQGTDIGFGLALRFYFKTEKLCPYFGLKAGALIYKVPESTSYTLDLIGGIAYGAEYFIDDNFSFGVELQGNIAKSDEFSLRFGNPDGINFNTATMVMATIYF
ncbi:MAG: hypothetical protein A2W91_16030 [Bacteroidetes bacterium GWF2_38_335]|nr:MAG: hypothetical protein A2W91_16030 [Bacteroidetes bacterium GWF2_38_335]OFY81198.1 MAG: hypothetical protein A2281_07005 [Bacteroidetes bacterium RIFOXYA12_FULL_38_20]HBS85314.1 hypothetical protein [Bacteroidales bacterium]